MPAAIPLRRLLQGTIQLGEKPVGQLGRSPFTWDDGMTRWPSGKRPGAPPSRTRGHVADDPLVDTKGLSTRDLRRSDRDVAADRAMSRCLAGEGLVMTMTGWPRPGRSVRVRRGQ